MKRVKRQLTGGGLYQKTTLPNGMRVVSERIPGIRSISVGIWVDVGSRHESPPESGLSHYIEHMVFKGTKRRTARQIADSLESIGGSLNAFTTRENTCFTARILDEHLPQAMDVLADITCHPTMSRTNLIREGMVICEEIKESLDNPADHVHDLFARTFWGEQPLGQPIMGTIDNIRQMTRRRMLEYK
ncbi:MAG: insulinase family protein, partial [Candidatus Zixiibacteriota bacterium]